MDTISLASNESIIHKTQTIIIEGGRYEAVLTSTRLVLVDSETGEIHEDIPYTEIGLAVSGVNRIREPVITISIPSAGAETKTIELIFIRQTDKTNLRDLEKCTGILKEHKVPFENKGYINESDLVRRAELANAGVLQVDTPTTRPAVPEWTLTGTSHHSRQAPKEELPERSPLITIAAVVIIIAIFVSGFVIVGWVMNAKNVPVVQNATGATTTTVVTASPSITPIPQPQETIVTESSNTRITVPTNGIWVQVSYPGRYSGYVGSQGWNTEVNSSGTRFYQLPVHDTTIDSFIEKGDGSNGKMVVEIYNGGTLVSKSETTKPHGMIELHTPVGPAIGTSAEIAPLPTEIQVSPYASLPQVVIPPVGVWVRVNYPGNFLGAIRANGQLKNINSTGDQFYQFPIAGGTIDGSIEKQDGSVKNLIVEVYKDGALVTHTYTSTPLGMVEIHTNV
ncbi:MAG: hypothetical protein Q8R70_05075 [Methanoregula sp.]|nr:hypothetical protein [Methanoregula sp.]